MYVSAQLKTKRTKNDNILKCIIEKSNDEKKHAPKTPINFFSTGYNIPLNISSSVIGAIIQAVIIIVIIFV